MKSFRILVLSNTRPSRVFRFAARVADSLPGAEICGIVQRPLSRLPLAQQCIAKEIVDIESRGAAKRHSATRWVRGLLTAIGRTALWVAHGCPTGISSPTKYTVRDLQKGCAQKGWPFLQAQELSDDAVCAFVRGQKPDLVVVLGGISHLPEIAFDPACGYLLATQTGALGSDNRAWQGEDIRIEHFESAFGAPHTVASFKLSRQTYDRLFGFTLKADLLVDDLLMRAVACLSAEGTSELEKGLTQWVEDMLVPYLAQTGETPAEVPAKPAQRRIRPWRSLSLETALLFFPAILFRNWLRRLRQKYPVLILTHHVVTDRSHRMAISTEAFWRQAQFLRRHYHLVSLSKAAAMLRSGRVVRPAVALTFDDGYVDNFISLRAVAEELGIPVAVFLTTQPVTLRSEFQHDVIRGIRGAFAMTWGQVRYWRSRGGEFGSHTRTHVKCGVVEQDVLDDEIIGSKAEFQAEMKEPPLFFAFPYGDRGNMPLHARRTAMQAYPYILSSYGGENLPDSSGDNAHLYRKIAYPDPWELELELQSVFDLVQRAKRRFAKTSSAGNASSKQEGLRADAAGAKPNAVIEQSPGKFDSHQSSNL